VTREPLIRAHPPADGSRRAIWRRPACMWRASA
jgi:hypothetical protein